VITLIANSGIQFVDRQINLSEGSPALKTSFYYYEHIYEFDGNELCDFFSVHFDSNRDQYVLKGRNPELTSFDSLMPEAIDPETWEVINEAKIVDKTIEIGNDLLRNTILPEKVLTMQARKAMELLEGEWLPLPYFKEHQGEGHLFMGPINWARLWFSKIPTTEAVTGATHNVVLVFDTQVTDNEANHVGIGSLDINGNVRFRVPNDDHHLSYFTDPSLEGVMWVEQWLDTIFKRKKILKPTDTDRFRHVAAYITLIKAFSKAGAFPPVSVYADAKTIEVDLILDIGNSRTCGILVETDTPDKVFRFDQARPLQLRDLTNPNKTYTDSFDMRVAFRRCTFGDESANVRSGNPKAFSWPSVVRLGKEAVRLSVIHEGTAKNATMSSPKRYLWDQNKRANHWNYIGENGVVASNDAVLKGITHLFDEAGVYQGRDKNAPFINAQNALYSRSSLMTFAFVELFLQSITYINSLSFRERQGSPTAPRKLKRIVLTCPTAMLDWEKSILREHAEDAIDALKQLFSSSFIDAQINIIPSTKDCKLYAEDKKKQKENWGFDEATCSQLAFIYGELMGHYRGKSSLFFEANGRFRTDSHFSDKRSVTIASIDIGGGTTDLMICEYQDASNSTNIDLLPNPRFWEGFNMAGDALLKSIIERVVLPVLQEEATAKGCADAFSCMNFLFGSDMGQQTDQDKFYRKQFANEVAYPIAVGILQHAADRRATEIKTFADFFVDFPRPTNYVTNHVNQIFQRYGAVNFNLEQLSWQLDTNHTNKVVKEVLEPMITDLCKVISQFNPEFVLLAGRPTMLPVVRELFLKLLPTTPDRLISLGGYEMGNWYPFANERGVVKDPKTCVAVGATVALMGGTLNRFERFRIDTTLLREKFDSTADYIGALDPQISRVKEAFFTPNNNEISLTFSGPMQLGMRQMNAPHWIANPMYKITWADNQVAQKYQNQMPLTIQLIRDPERDKENIRVQGAIQDKNGRGLPPSVIKIGLQTILDANGHWLDTGCFSMDKNR
jgi:hypothetical protein